MALTQPALNAVPFANSGSKNTIPKTSTVTGKASMTQGFPDVTMLPIASGGLPPSGKDFNGILNQLSQHQVWQNAGGMYKFDATFCTAIGGYPKGAVVLSNDGLSAYICTSANNSNDPNSNMTGWAVFGGKQVVDSLQDHLNASDPHGQYALESNTISAGNGLTGGGSLAANRTLSMGTPGQITASSTNATTTTSHTHAIDSASTSREGIVQLNDSLTNTSTALALTAKQGKVLKDLIDGIDVDVSGKVSKTGDTMTGNLTVNGDITTSGGISAHHLNLSQGFLRNPASPGNVYNNWTLLANGLILQWGFVSWDTMLVKTGMDDDERSAIITLPISFVNQLINAQCSLKTSQIGDRADTWSQVVNTSRTSITVQTQWNGQGNFADGIEGVYWMALGY